MLRKDEQHTFLFLSVLNSIHELTVWDIIHKI